MQLGQLVALGEELGVQPDEARAPARHVQQPGHEHQPNRSLGPGLRGLRGAGRRPRASGIPPPYSTPGADAVNALLTGIPTQGTALGNPTAPLTLEEFADLQCPYCREFEVSVLPDLIQRYVRAGKLRVVFSDISILGPDSSKAASYAAAAGLPSKLWPYIELWYQNQKQENTGYVTPSYLLHIATGIPGLA